MNKFVITVEIPDGYELAEGKQPRLAKAGDYYCDFADTSKVKRAIINFENEPMIVLEKTTPDYQYLTLYDRHGPEAKMDGIRTRNPAYGKYVEVKAIEHTLDIIQRCLQNRAYCLTDEDAEICKELRGLLK